MMAPRIATLCGLVLLMNSLSHAQTADWRHEMKLADYLAIRCEARSFGQSPFASAATGHAPAKTVAVVALVTFRNSRLCMLSSHLTPFEGY